MDLLQAWGIRPIAVVGHSSGEIAAAYAAGLLTASQAMIVAYYRGRVCSQASQVAGAMLAVRMGKEEILPKLDAYEGKVGIACVNSPKSVTLSGDAECIKSLQHELAEAGASVRYVLVPVAYHSHHMQPIGATYLDLLENTTNFVPRDTDGTCPMFSSVTGELLQLDDKRLTAEYWRRNLESPVLFSDSVQNMVRSVGTDTLIEIGSHSSLSGPIRHIRDAMGLGAEALEYIPTIVRGQCAVKAVLDTAGRLYTLGHTDLNFEAINGVEKWIVPGANELPIAGDMTDIPQYESRNVLVDLPSYAWDHSQKYWLEGQRTKEWRFRKHGRHDLIGSRIPGNDSSEPQWMNVLSVANAPWLQHHQVVGNITIPATAYICMAIEALTQHLESLGKFKPEEAFLLRRISIHKPLILTAIAGTETLSAIRGTVLFLTLRQKQRNSRDESKWFAFAIRTMGEHTAGMVTHCTGSICTIPRKHVPKPNVFSNEVREGLRLISKDALYEALAAIGLNYGKAFAGLKNVRSRMDLCEMIGETDIIAGAMPRNSNTVGEGEVGQAGAPEPSPAVKASLEALHAVAGDGAQGCSSGHTGGTDLVLDLPAPRSPITTPETQNEKASVHENDIPLAEMGEGMQGTVSDIPELMRRLEAEDTNHIDSRYVVHPINLDNLLQLSYAALHGGRLSSIKELLIPMFIQQCGQQAG